MHDGHLNTCTFSKDGKRITLSPSSPSQLHKSKPQTNKGHSDLLLTFSEPLIKASNHESKAFKEWTLTSHEESEAPSSRHPHPSPYLTIFLMSFQNPEDIPPGLPPKRSIQHHSELISKAIFPNKSVYRMNPKETMEVQRQVDESVSKGFVRERLSPCVVPTLLVPKKDGSIRICMDG